MSSPTPCFKQDTLIRLLSGLYRQIGKTSEDGDPLTCLSLVSGLHHSHEKEALPYVQWELSLLPLVLVDSEKLLSSL